MNRTQLAFKLKEKTNYEELLKQYDREVLDLIAAHNPNFLTQPVYIFDVSMNPERLNWM